MNGKGSNPRPLSVRREEYGDRWNETFRHDSIDADMQQSAARLHAVPVLMSVEEQEEFYRQDAEFNRTAKP